MKKQSFDKKSSQTNPDKTFQLLQILYNELWATPISLSSAQNNLTQDDKLTR